MGGGLGLRGRLLLGGRGSHRLAHRGHGLGLGRGRLGHGGLCLRLGWGYGVGSGSGHHPTHHHPFRANLPGLSISFLL